MQKQLNMFCVSITNYPTTNQNSSLSSVNTDTFINILKVDAQNSKSIYECKQNNPN